MIKPQKISNIASIFPFSLLVKTLNNLILKMMLKTKTITRIAIKNLKNELFRER